MASNMIHEFNKSIEIGKRGEQEFIELFSQLPTVNQIVDLRDSPEMRENDIDFLVRTPKGNFTLELKTDTYASGNFFIETISAKETHSVGWAFKSKAQFLAYYFIKYQKIYIFKMKDIQKIAGSSSFLEFRKTLQNKWKDGTYTSEGLAIPVNTLCAYVREYSIYEVETK